MKPFVTRTARAAMGLGYLARVGDERRQQVPPLQLFARAAMQDITKPKKNKPEPEPLDIDPMAAAQAAAASAAVYGLYEGLINAIRSDLSLTPTQRAGLIASLRARAKVEAKEASRRVMDAAKGAAKQLRAMMRPTRGRG